MPRALAISCDGMDCDQLLAQWRWLVPVEATPLMIGIFGDWIFGMPDGSLCHLDLLEGTIGQVARDFAEFNAKKREEKYRDDWFGANWANIALERGLVPNDEECLGWKLAPVLGGEFSVENLQVFSLVVYQCVSGQLFRRLFQG